jgi:hypothetical protein
MFIFVPFIVIRVGEVAKSVAAFGKWYYILCRAVEAFKEVWIVFSIRTV